MIYIQYAGRSVYVPQFQHTWCEVNIGISLWVITTGSSSRGSATGGNDDIVWDANETGTVRQVLVGDALLQRIGEAGGCRITDTGVVLRLWLSEDTAWGKHTGLDIEVLTTASGTLSGVAENKKSYSTHHYWFLFKIKIGKEN